MLLWLMRATQSPSVLDGLHVFQTTGSLIPALFAVTAPIVRQRFLSKGHHHV